MAEIKNKESCDRHPYRMFPGAGSVLGRVGQRWDDPFEEEELEYVALLYFFNGVPMFPTLIGMPTRRLQGGTESVRGIYDELREKRQNTDLPGLSETLCRPEEISVLVLINGLSPVLISG